MTDVCHDTGLDLEDAIQLLWAQLAVRDTAWLGVGGLRATVRRDGEQYVAELTHADRGRLHMGHFGTVHSACASAAFRLVDALEEAERTVPPPGGT